MKKLNWQSHYADVLGENPSEVSSSTSAKEALTLFLKSKKISTEEYLVWAREELQIPSLKNQFFAQHDRQRTLDLMEKHQFLNVLWGPLCLPVGEWEGHLIIAGCLFNESIDTGSTICVLADFNLLLNLWESCQLSLRSQVQSQAQSQTQSQVLSNLPSPEIEPKVSRPVDLKFNEPALLELQPIELKPIEPNDPKEIEELMSDEITGAHFSVSTTNNEGLEGLDGIVVKSGEPEAPIGLGHGLGLGLEHSSPMPAKIQISNPNADIQPRLEKILQSSKPATPKLDPGPTTRPAPARAQAQQRHAALSAAWKEIQVELHTFYEKNFLLLIDEDFPGFYVLLSSAENPEAPGMSLSPSDQQKNSPKEELCFTLKKDSIFRIATLTKRPFHGYVVTNEVNAKFFNEWNEESFPDMVSLAPIVIQQKTKALIMGLGPSQSYNKNSLSLIERLAEKLGQSMDQELLSNDSLASGSLTKPFSSAK